MHGLAALEPLVWGGAAVSAPSQARVAHQLLQSAAMLGLARPLPAAVPAARALADGYRANCIGTLTVPLDGRKRVTTQATWKHGLSFTMLGHNLPTLAAILAQPFLLAEERRAHGAAAAAAAELWAVVVDYRQRPAVLQGARA